MSKNKSFFTLFLYVFIAFTSLKSTNNMEYAKINLPPLDLLLRDWNLMEVRHIINTLKNNKNLKCGLLLQGPTGVGKHTIAEIIAQKSGKELISTLQEEIKTSFIQKATGINRNKELNLILLSLIKKAYNKKAILLIDKVEDFLQTNAFDRLSRIAYKNPAFLVIGITNDSTILKQDQRIKEFLSPVNIGLPSFDLRKNILSFYLRSNKNNDFNNSDSNSSDNKVYDYTLDSLATATRNYTGSELEEIATNAIKEFNQNSEITSSASFFYRWKHDYDFKDKKAYSLLTNCFIVPLIHAYSPTKIEQYLWANQQAHDQEKKVKS